ncbi:MAG: hypothetical protein PQJ59_06660 [Spirochaetales bacterium]|nr:hypothetical protein [Spirochaetales bacterium]
MTEWEESLFTLKETSFLNLLKNYIVDLSTPFNKQEMIKKLALWLGKAEHLDKLALCISEEERMILSAIHFLEGVHSDKLPLSWTDKQKENLKERLLIYENHDRIHLTPVLVEPFKERGIIDFSLLLEIVKEEGEETASFTPDDRLFMGFLSYFSVEKPFYLSDGTPRRKIVDELQEKLPYPAHWEDSFFGELAELFLQAGLLKKKENNLILGPKEELERFENFRPHERLLYLALLNGPASSRGRLRFLLNRLKTLLPPGSGLGRNGWKRLLYFIIPQPNHRDIALWEDLPTRLSLLGICTLNGDNIFFTGEKGEEKNESLRVHVQPNGDIDLPPGTAFKSSLVMSATLGKGETFYHFHLTRESFEAGLRRGKSSRELIGDLENLAGSELPGNLIMNFQEWEKQLHAIRKVPGILLQVGGYPRKIMDRIPELQEHILEKIADQWILMREETEEEWRLILAQVSLNPFEEHKLELSPDSGEFPDEEWVNLPDGDHRENWTHPLSHDKREELLDHLKTLELPEEQEKEFTRRIERGVILLKEQLTPAVLRSELCKAGGLDFNSKLRQISVAVDNEYARLELKLPGKGEIRTVKAVPLKLSNSREESLLTFRNEANGEEETVAVRKILEVIRFHGSLLS